MGAHSLREIGLIGRDEVLAVVPDFDLYHLGQVVRLALSRRETTIGERDDCTLEVEAEYRAAGTQGNVLLRLGGLRSALLPRLSPSFSFSELEIEDVSGSQLEGARFQLLDHGMSAIEILCKTVEIRWLAEDGS